MSSDPSPVNGVDSLEKTRPSANPHYRLLGGERGVLKLVEHFYRIMDTDPYAASIRAMHPADLTETKAVLHDYLSGWLGGPNLYEAKRGHPRLRQRHMRFSIGEAERDQWLYCMANALNELGVEEALRYQLLAAFLKTADHLRNQ
jgi:hemoglobin